MSGPSYVSAVGTLGLTAADLTFDDEFTSFVSSPDGSAGWATQMPYSGPSARGGGTNGTVSYASDSSVGVNPFTDQNGILTINAAKSSTPLPYGLTWTSGLIESRYLASQTYGYYEIGVETPVPTGLWSSFFLLPDNASYGGEIDAAEVLSSNSSDIYSTTHSLTPTGAPAVDLTEESVTNLSAGFNTIGVDWTPTEIYWFVNGVEVTQQPTPYGVNSPMFMVIALAVGGPGSWPGAPAASTTSAALQVDYVRSYATSSTIDVSGSGVIATGSITGHVALPGGGAASGVTVSLVDAGSNVIASATTDTTGAFTFSKLAAGSYRVLYGASGADVPATGSLANAVTGLSNVIAVTDGTTVTLGTEALAPSTLATVTGTVLFEATGSSTGTAQSGVVVTLLNATGTVLDTTVTDATGTFRFGNLAAGTYKVSYTSLLYDVFVSGPGGAGGTTATFTVAAGATTTLGAETLTPAPGEVTGTILYSGSHSEGWVGTGEAGVTVSLLNTSGTVVATTTTTSNGTYAFTGVIAGNYYVEATPPTGQTIANGFGINIANGETAKLLVAADRGTIAPSITLIAAPAPGISGSVLFSATSVSGANPGVTVALYNNTDSTLLATTTTALDGTFAFADMEPGTYYLRYTAPTGETFKSGPANSSGVAAVTIAAAGPSITVAPETLTGTAGAVTGTVLFAPTTAPAAPEAGVTVELLNASLATVETSTTNSAGQYSFQNLIPETYYLTFVLPAGQRVVAGGPAYSSGGTPPIAVGAGKTVVEPNQTLSVPTGTIVGTASYGAVGEAGVTVSLIENGSAIATTTSTSDGVFSFRYVVPGPYQLLYAIPSGQVPQAGGPADATGLTSAFTVVSGQTLDTPGETFVAAGSQTGAITGSALLGTAALAGVSVALLNAAGTSTIATTTTNASGAFSFTGLAAGSYQVQYTAPAGDVLQSGPGSTSTGLTGALTVTAGQTLTLAAETLAAAVSGISGSIVHTGSGDPGTGIGAVLVSLLNGSGTTLRTTMTAGSGAFSFKSLTAGTYELRYSLPAGEAFQSGGAVNPATGITAPITFTTGEALALPAVQLVSSATTFALNGPSAAAVRGDGAYVVTGNATSASLRLGSGNQSVTLTGFSDTVTTGNGNQTISLAGTGNVVTVGNGTQSINAGSGFDTVTLGATPAGTTSTIQLGGPGDKVVASGNGNVSVGGPTGSASITLGNGNQTVTLGGSGNTVTVGTGTSTITAGQNSNIVHAGGGDTINITGQGNLLDAGAGMNFYNAASTSRLDTFMLNASGQGLTAIAGFNASDTLDLARTVSGLGVASDLSNLANFVTSSVSNASTTLFVSSGASQPYAFATLSNVSTSVAQLLAGHNFSLT